MILDKDGGSAFPKLESLSSKTPAYTVAQSTGGLSMRDYFAAKALQGLLANNSGDYYITHVQSAYAIADMMLAERAKITKP